LQFQTLGRIAQDEHEDGVYLVLAEVEGISLQAGIERKEDLL
jgi:hypothetical protein